MRKALWPNLSYSSAPGPMVKILISAVSESGTNCAFAETAMKRRTRNEKFFITDTNFKTIRVLFQTAIFGLLSEYFPIEFQRKNVGIQCNALIANIGKGIVHLNAFISEANPDIRLKPYGIGAV